MAASLAATLAACRISAGRAAARVLGCGIGWGLVWSVAAGGASGGAYAAELDVVSPDRSAAYTEVAQTIATEWARLSQGKGDARLVYLSDGAGSESPAAGGPQVIVTLGREALARVLAREPRVPVIAALIPKAGFERVLKDAPKKPAEPVVALYLEQPMARQVELLRLALPDAKRVGVLWGAESILQAGALRSNLQARGLELSGAYVGDAKDLFTSLKTALDDTDVLLAVPDPGVYNGANIANLLLATYRARVPVMAFSPAYVRAGALLSLHSSPRQIGHQAAAMARAQWLGATAGSGAVGGAGGSRFPSDFTVAVNEHVARSLGLSLDEQVLTERLRRAEKRP
jgi:putative ABC transport system substrate-binding protein